MQRLPPISMIEDDLWEPYAMDPHSENYGFRLLRVVTLHNVRSLFIHCSIHWLILSQPIMVILATHKVYAYIQSLKTLRLLVALLLVQKSSLVLHNFYAPSDAFLTRMSHVLLRSRSYLQHPP